MDYIFINLKRFDVPQTEGGLCPVGDPIAWIQSVLSETVEHGLDRLDGLRLVYLLPEGLVPTAARMLAPGGSLAKSSLEIGSQGLHWEDVERDGNFGAFTASLPASAARALGASWSILGHSEERRAKLEVMARYAPSIEEREDHELHALEAVDSLVHEEILRALIADLNVLVCVGESASQRGEESTVGVSKQVEGVLEGQVLRALDGTDRFWQSRSIVVGYEPIWAIGPGKTPPGKEYISQASSVIKRAVKEKLGFEVPVVYGGGLKEENAAMIAAIETVDGGLVALTRFSGQIGFDVQGLSGIIRAYRSGNGAK